MKKKKLIKLKKILKVLIKKFLWKKKKINL